MRRRQQVELTGGSTALFPDVKMCGLEVQPEAFLDFSSAHLKGKSFLWIYFHSSECFYSKRNTSFSKRQITCQKTLISQSISDQLQISYGATQVIAEGSLAADKSWCSTSAKKMMFRGGAGHNVKQRETGGNEFLSFGCLLALLSLFSCSSMGGTSVGHDNKSWDGFPPNYFFHSFIPFAVEPRCLILKKE